jgi:CHAD domain-containing protein
LRNHRQVKLPEGFDAGQIESFLVDRYALLREDPVIQKLTFYDTFDWLLFNKSLTLYRNDQELVLRQLPDGEGIITITDISSPVFAWDFPEGVLKDQLASIIEVRALLPLGEIFMHSITFRILNQDQKMVARLVFTQISTPATGDDLILDTYLSVIPVRGYPKYARQLTEQLNELGDPIFIWEEVYTRAMQVAAKVPGSYSTKLDLQLEPEMRTDEAVRAILRRLLAVMRANEEGIRADFDIEFLHDYRVAIRRTRSALSQIKDIFPAQAVARFRQDFADLGELSNELRDLDVYLLAEQAYRDMLPAAIKDDISPLFEYLRSRRPQALQRVIDQLDSPAYANFIAQWEAFLDEPLSTSTAAPNADRPVFELAQARIHKRYRNIIKDGTYLLEHPSDELMHPLRIECKKLRYLIEFFASLFPPRSVSTLVNQLKMLQDNLGEFNDLIVQQNYLLNISEQLPLPDIGSRRTLVAIGALVQSLEHQQQIVRAEFAKTFTSFASSDNKKRYRKLFTSRIEDPPHADDRPVQQ